MSIFSSEPTHIVITKRKATRKIYIPNGSSWRDLATEYPAKFFRFHSDRTVYRRGQLEVIFNLDGKAIEGWSYWTCIYCYAEPTDDFPQGRLIYNQSGYGNTTSKHICDMRAFFGSEDRVVVTRKRYTRVHRTELRKSHYSERRSPTQVYTREYLVSFDTDRVDPVTEYQATQICWGRGASPEGMREELRTMRKHRPWAVQRAEREAEQAAYWARIEAQSAAAAQLDQDEAQAINDGRANSPALRVINGGVA